MSIEGQGHFLPYIFQVLYVLCFTGPRYQVSVYRTIGPLVLCFGIVILVIFHFGFEDGTLVLLHKFLVIA